jgi:hypothetical protein
MLVSSCSDPRSAATSEHNAAETDVAEADADGAAALGEGLPADAGLLDALPPELQAAASSTRPDRRMFRHAGRLSVTLLILRERAAGRPASPHARRVIPQRSAQDVQESGSCGGRLEEPGRRTRVRQVRLLVPDGRVLAASASVTPLVTASWPRDPAAQRQQVPAELTGSGFGGSHDGCLGRAAFHVRG